MRKNIWGWNPTGRKFWFIVIMIFGHIVWIIFGRNSQLVQWRLFLNKPSIITKTLFNRWYYWRYIRLQRIHDINQANKEIAKLQLQINDLLTTKIVQSAKLMEAEEAIRLLGLKKAMPIDLKAARIIAGTNKAPFGCFIIDQGRDANVVINQGIISPDGIVGRIWDVSDNYSSVLPIDAYNSSTGVLLENSRATGVLQGIGQGRAVIRYVNNQETVQIGEPVFTSGLDGIFPRGLLVGYVSAVKKQDMELKIEVSIAAKLDRLWLVLLITENL